MPRRGGSIFPVWDEALSLGRTGTIEDQEVTAEPAVSQEAIDPKKRLAGLIRARMAKPATTTEKRLWQELKAEVEKERLSFRP